MSLVANDRCVQQTLVYECIIYGRVGWGVSPQCDNMEGVWDLGTKDLFSVFAAGLHIPELILVPSEPPFPPLYIDGLQGPSWLT